MTYGSRPQRMPGREGSVSEWRGRQPADWRDYSDDSRYPVADQAVGWLIDHGFFETVGLAPDGDLLLRLTDQAWDTEHVVGESTLEVPQPQQGAARGRTRPRRRQPAGNQEVSE